MSTQSPASGEFDTRSPSPSLVGRDNIPPERKLQTRPHPPRLQHSPSLPNLWFPPHSGPIPERFINASRDNLHLPSTPPSLMTHFPLPDGALVTPAFQQNDKQFPDTQKAQARNFVNNFNKAAASKPVPTQESSSQTKVGSQSQTQKLQKRHRVEHTRPHLLLTPPLTPSSSIKTTTSVESGTSTSISGGVGGNGDHDVQGMADGQTEDESDMTSTRFLLLANVSKRISSTALRSAIVSALTSIKPDASHFNSNTYANLENASLSPLVTTFHLPVASKKNHFVNNSESDHIRLPTHANENPIKGMYISLQKSHGIVILAFYDVRDAKRARRTLLLPADALAECVDELGEGGKGCFVCRFVTIDEVVKLTGNNSAFLTTTDGTFSLAVESERVGNFADQNGEGVAKDGKGETDTLADSDLGINSDMLKSVLSSFGTLRTFAFTDQKEGDQVEYFDVRDTDTAYSALDGQIIFGMKLRVFGRQANAEYPHRNHHIDGTCQPISTHPKARTTASQNYIPFPSSRGSEPPLNDIPLQFGPPGQQSQTRERFSPLDTAGKARPRSVSAGHDARFVPSSSLSPTSASKYPAHVDPSTCLCTSSPSSAVTTADIQTHDIHGRRNSNHLFFDAVGKANGAGTSPSPDLDSERPRSLSFDVGDVSGKDVKEIHRWENDPSINQNIIASDSHIYNSHRQCDYYPSRNPASGPHIGHSYYDTSPLSTPYYLPSQSSHYAPSPVFFPLPPPSPVGFGYSLNHQPPVINPATVDNWAFQQPMMVATTGLVGGVSAAHGEYWLPGAHGVAMPGNHGSYYIRQQQGYQHVYSTAPKKSHAHMYRDPYLQGSSVYVPDLRSSSPPSPSPSHLPLNLTPHTPASAIASIRDSAIPPERNQLNLARIEDGQDTRTTVMIKNIPNKMSDQDLVAYIGKVCPRRIDFLYLRMDFQNGCNVGYAFVNFIHVQDLLSFAKKRLGEKWNMFSSEKVLQMSYANYQGKEALVEKFKNSCIMDEREAWRPKIFYSEGPEQGLPEPFPAPTHFRRKERSSHNRGALFVPGIGSGGQLPPSSHMARRLQYGDR